MGYYTEFKFTGKLKKNTPEEVVDFLKRILIEKDIGVTGMFKHEDVKKPNFNHNFFKCERWYMLFISNNFDKSIKSTMYASTYNWVIDIHSEFKNYDNEIDEFIDWIKPFLKGRKKRQYLGWRQGENWECPRQYLHIDLSNN